MEAVRNTMATRDIHLDIPDKYLDHSVKLLIDNNKKESKDNESKFLSFRMPTDFSDGSIMVNERRIPFSVFYSFLREEAGLTDKLPICVNLHTEEPFVEILTLDARPECFPSKRVWFFHWKGIVCSLTGNLFLRFHEVTLQVALSTLGEIIEGALARVIEPVPEENILSIFVANYTMGQGWEWKRLNQRNHRSMDTIYLPSEMKTAIMEDIETFLKSSSLYDEYGVAWKHCVLLSGEP